MRSLFFLPDPYLFAAILSPLSSSPSLSAISSVRIWYTLCKCNNCTASHKPKSFVWSEASLTRYLLNLDPVAQHEAGTRDAKLNLLSAPAVAEPSANVWFGKVFRRQADRLQYQRQRQRDCFRKEQSQQSRHPECNVMHGGVFLWKMAQVNRRSASIQQIMDDVAHTMHLFSLKIEWSYTTFWLLSIFLLFC